MDPTAPKNPLDPNAPPAEPNPIQPGQFVVAGGEPPLPSAEPPQPVVPPPLASSIPDPEPLPPIPPTPEPALGGLPPIEHPEPPAPGLSLAQETNAPPIRLAAEPPGIPPAPTTEPMGGLPPLEQPDPTPYVPPPASAPKAQGARPSLIQRFRIFLIIGGGVILLGVASAVAWFFLFNNAGSQPKPVAEEQEIPIQEPSPPAKRTEGGFADLPAATGSAPLQSTPSAR